MTPRDVEREEWIRIPVIQEMQQKWIADAKSPFEKLARLWQCESRTLGIRPHDATPPEIFTRRMRQLWQVWEKWESGGYRSQPTSGAPETASASPSLASGLSASQPSTASSVGERSHGAGCVCEQCFNGVMSRASRAGVLR